MNAHRLVALRLAGLHRQDRLWLLRRLPRQDRPQIRRALRGLMAQRFAIPLTQLSMAMGGLRLMPASIRLSQRPVVSQRARVERALRLRTRDWPAALQQLALAGAVADLPDAVVGSGSGSGGDAACATHAARVVGNLVLRHPGSDGGKSAWRE